MNQIETLREVLKKYHLFNPVPMEVQKQLFRTKKETLRAILKEKKGLSFSVRIILLFHYLAKSIGFDLSYRGSRTFAGGAAFAAAVLIVAGTLIILMPQFLPRAADDAVVICVIGEARIDRGAVKGILRFRDVLKQGDIVSTGKESIAVVQIGEKKLLRIEADSVVKVSSMLSTSEDLLIEKGTILSKLAKLGRGYSYRIKTPVLIAAVRGTSFSVSAGENESIIAVREGTVAVTHSAKNMNYSIEGGKAISADTASSVIRPISKTEELTIKKIDEIPFRKAEDMQDMDTIRKEVERIDTAIAGEMKALEDTQLPQTLEEIRAKYGRIDVVTLYTGKVHRGVILQRGQMWKMLVPGRYEYFPTNKVKDTGSR